MTASASANRRGVIVAAAAAACFGVTVPLVQRFGRDTGAWFTAALLYTGAFIVAGAARGRGDRERSSNLRPHALRVIGCAILGAAIAPAALAMGLRIIDGASASLMLGVEAVFTVLFARVLYRELITARLALALAFMIAGGLVLVRPSLAAPRSMVGAALVLLAVVCWAADSALMRPLADLDGTTVVRAKSLVGVLVAVAIAFAARESVPALAATVALTLCGALGYGVSLRLYLLAQRHVGAARTASVFSIAPFFGAIVAIAIGVRAGIAWLALAGALLACGVTIQATEN